MDNCKECDGDAFISINGKLKCVSCYDYYNRRFHAETVSGKLVNSKKLKEVQKKLDIAIDALEFYGNIDNWNSDETFAVDDDFEMFEVDDDGNSENLGGKHARETLKQVKENA